MFFNEVKGYGNLKIVYFGIEYILKKLKKLFG